MIVLEKLDLQARCAVLRALAGTRGQALHVVGRLQSPLEQLGVDRVGLVLTSGQRLEVGRLGARADRTPPSTTGVEPRSVEIAAHSAPLDGGKPSAGGHSLSTTTAGRSADLEHRLEMDAGVPTYISRFTHRRDCLETIAIYTGIVVATHGPLRGARSFFHLALYELIANVLDHGHLRATPSELELGLRLESDVIGGWIQDRCERFDPRSAPLPPLTQHLVNRPRRGYGLHMVFNILDSLSHDFDGTGNRLAFWKEIPS